MPHKTLIVAAPAAREELAVALRRLGFVVIEAAGPASAFDALEREPVDLAVIDVAAAGEDAAALVRKLRERFGALEVLVAAAAGDRPSALHCLPAGAFAALRLPLERLDLEAAANNALEHKTLASEHASLLHRLAAANRLASLGQLASGVAHEVKNPLAYVIDNANYLGEMLESLEGEGQQARIDSLRQAAREAHDGAVRIREIIRDIGALVSPDETTRTPLDVNEAIRAAIRLTRFEVRDRVKVVSRLGQNARVLGSPGRLSQVFINLIVNAAQAIGAEPSVQPGRIALVSRREAGRVIVEVSDNGPGIARQDLPRVFDAFFTTKPEGEGTGLGLFLCRDIVRRHGGEIRVRTSATHGTTFTVELPAEDASTPRPRDPVAGGATIVELPAAARSAQRR